MEQFIGCDAHKKFSVFVSLNEKGEYGPSQRVGHEREVFRSFLQTLPPGSQIALETGGCYYWMVDEMEQAGHVACLAHAFTAKRRMEGRHKTNERDARGLAMLWRNGTLPKVWIPPAELRDQREMLRWRMTLSNHRTRLKNRIHGLLQRYNVDITIADVFGDRGREELLARQEEVPVHSRESMRQQLYPSAVVPANVPTRPPKLVNPQTPAFEAVAQAFLPVLWSFRMIPSRLQAACSAVGPPPQGG